MWEALWTLSSKDQIESIEGNFRMRAFLATMGFNSIMTICMSVIVFCSFSIVAHFRLVKFEKYLIRKFKYFSSTHVEWSGKTKKLQQQLFHTLVVQVEKREDIWLWSYPIQMIIPMVFVYFPCAGIINLPMFGFRMSVFPNLVSASLTIFPLIDAFIIMFGVKSYR